MTNQEKIADLKSARKVLKEEIERLEQEDGGVTAAGGPGKDPVPPDPTHPNT